MGARAGQQSWTSDNICVLASCAGKSRLQLWVALAKLDPAQHIRWARHLADRCKRVRGHVFALTRTPQPKPSCMVHCAVSVPQKNEIERHGCMVVTKCSLNRVLSCSQRVAMTPTAAFHALLALSSLSPISAAAWGGRASRTVGVPPDAAAIVGVGSEIPDTMQYRQAVSPSAASSEQQSPLRSVTSADQPFGRPMLAEFMLANYTNLNHGSFGATPRAGEFAHRSCTAYMSLQHESKISALFMLSHTTWPHRALRSSGSLVQLPSLDNIGCGQSLARLWSLSATFSPYVLL
jgi:hypothetical protein